MASRVSKVTSKNCRDKERESTQRERGGEERDKQTRGVGF